MSSLATVVSPDFLITGGGSTCRLTPLSLAAQNWCRDRFTDHLTTGSYVLSHVDLAKVVTDINESSLKVRWEYV